MTDVPCSQSDLFLGLVMGFSWLSGVLCALYFAKRK